MKVDSKHNLIDEIVDFKDAKLESDKEFDKRWVLSLFGTALGAGILFLPIAVGAGGFWAVVLMTIIAFPMAYLSHRAFSRFVLGVPHIDSDITHVAEEYWGRRASLILTILYFFVIYPVVLAYGVGITNTFSNFLIYQLDITHLYTIKTSVDSNGNELQTKELLPYVRAILAFVLVGSMILIMLLKEKWVTRICTALVYPLCFVLMGFSLYLIGFWKLDSIKYVPEAKDFIIIVYFTLPVLVFSFDFSPVISTFSVSVKRRYGKTDSIESNLLVDKKASSIIFKTTFMLLIFTMFFTFSCILCLDSNDFKVAREANIPILSYFANAFVESSSGTRSISYYIFSYAAPFVAFLAIITSFFGHYFGAYEGLTGIIRKSAKMMGNKQPNLKKIHIFNTIFLFISVIIVSYLNPSILDFIENLSGPIIAVMLLLMPIYAIYTIARLKKYQNKFLDLFVFIIGSITLSCMLYDSFKNLFLQ